MKHSFVINMETIRFSFKDVQKLQNDEYSCLELITKSRIIILAPRFIGKIVLGIREQFDREVNLYSDLLEGVLLSYSNIKLIQSYSLTQDDKPYLNLHVQADFMVFRPHVGCILKAVVNKISKDHIGCLVHRHFNASVPRGYRSGDGAWEGSQLKQGDEFLLKVSGLSSSNKVVFIKGCLTDNSFLSQPSDNLVGNTSRKDHQEEAVDNPDKDKKSKKKKHKSKDKNISVTECEHKYCDSIELVPTKKSKRKRSHDTDADSGIVDSCDLGTIELESKRLKGDNQDTAQVVTAETFSTNEDLAIINVKKHKKKKHKNK